MSELVTWLRAIPHCFTLSHCALQQKTILCSKYLRYLHHTDTIVLCCKYLRLVCVVFCLVSSWAAQCWLADVGPAVCVCDPLLKQVNIQLIWHPIMPIRAYRGPIEEPMRWTKNLEISMAPEMSPLKPTTRDPLVSAWPHGRSSGH